MTRILLAGNAVLDFVFTMAAMPRRAEKYRADDAYISGGGNAANSAVAASRLGAQAMLACRLGEDPVGALILDDLAREGVDTSLVRRVPGAVSSFSSIYVDGAGERQIMNFRGRGLGEETGWMDQAPRFDAVMADNRVPSLTRKAIDLATARGVPAIIDAEPPFDEVAVRGASHIAFSWQGLRTFTGLDDPGSALTSASERLRTWVCVTDGANGTYYLEDGHVVNVPAIVVEAVDTLGAGDVWHAAFALMLAEGADIPAAVRFANAAGSLKCTRPGGRNGAPARAEVETFLAASV